MNKPVLAAERIQSLDISLDGLAVGTLVRTPGDYDAFNLLPAYRSLNDPPIFSLSLRSADGSLRRDPKPIRGALPPFFANLLPEEKLREAMEKHHAASVRSGNDFDLLAARRPRSGRARIRRQEEGALFARRCADEALRHEKYRKRTGDHARRQR